MKNINSYILFPSYNIGMQLEAWLKKEKIKYTIVPAPRQLITCCGMAIMYDEADKEKIMDIVQREGINITGFFKAEASY